MSFMVQRTAAVVVLVLAASVGAWATDAPVPFSRAAYEPVVAKDKAIVLVSANWARRWKCGAFENAQLQSLGFDRVGSNKAQSDKPDVMVEDGSWLPAKPGFVNFALIVEPGEYLLSSYKIKAAKSMSDVGYLSGDRTTLISDGKSKAGSFSAGAGELVYIGHFALDCAQAPMPWRYYPEDKADFAKYLELVGKEYPGLPTDQATFRFFQTSVMGNPDRPPER